MATWGPHLLSRRWPWPLVLLVVLQLSSVATEEDTFDHSAQHCHDVSIWGEVAFRDTQCDKCETQFEQQCQEQTRTVCDQVPTTTCQLVAFTDCRMVMEEVPYTETEVITEGQYVPWQCSNFTREEIHQKLVPRCVNVTRQDCVTKWVVAPTGEKIWAGNEQCTPVTWLNCTLVAEPKAINQTYTKCERTGTPIPTMACRLVNRTRMVSGMKCDVKTAVDCNCTHAEQCVVIIYQECSEVARPVECQPHSLRVPFQPRIHRVKCLLADDDENPALDVEESANTADAAFDKQEEGEGGEY